MISPVPELSFLPAQYRGSTRAGESRVQDNLHPHAQNDTIFSPQIEGKTIFGSTFQIWLVAQFSLIKNMSINPKSVEFYQCHANPHLICFFYHNIKGNERNLYQDLLTIENTDSDLKVHGCIMQMSYAPDFPFKNFCIIALHTETIRKKCLGKE